ncbi:MAG: hypothetical protein AB4372_21595 [Xenococcus sp. (in: cyanobacteria)]
MPHTSPLPLFVFVLLRFPSGFTQVKAINCYPCCLFVCALVLGELTPSFLLTGVAPLLARVQSNKPCSYSLA